MRTQLTERAIRYAITQIRRGRPKAEVAAEIGVSARHVRRLWARFRKTGKHHVPLRRGRRAAAPPAPGEVQAVLDLHGREPLGVQRTVNALRLAGRFITYYRAYRIMRDNGLVVPSAARSKKRKWVRYERMYANAMWHTDWHEMKDLRFRGFKLVTYLDDSSRCVTGAGVFKEATSENAVRVLRGAVRRFGTPATVLSDNGSCFVGRGGRRKGGGRAPSGSWRPTAFEDELLDRGIELINSRPYHPQTNGKLERFHGTVEAEIGHFESLSDYIGYYNERRLHFSLDMASGETPLKAFSSRKATEAIRKNDPKWMERDRDD